MTGFETYFNRCKHFKTINPFPSTVHPNKKSSTSKPRHLNGDVCRIYQRSFHSKRHTRCLKLQDTDPSLLRSTPVSTGFRSGTPLLTSRSSTSPLSTNTSRSTLKRSLRGSTTPLTSSLSLGHGLSGSLSLLLLLPLQFFGIAIEEEIHHNIPLRRPRHTTTETENLASKKPVEKSDRLFTLVVSGDSDVNVAERRVRVTESNSGQVHVGGLTNGLHVSARISDYEETGFEEFLLDLVGEGTGGETTGEHLSTSVLTELQHSPLAVGASGNDAHISGVLDGDNDASSEHEFLPSLGKIKDVNAVGAALEYVLAHLEVASLGSKMHRACKHLLEVFFRSGEGTLKKVSHCLSRLI
mmetsp:Transcript_6064/g.14772  ORF Transcript_6064/g.14772 Transcript_6064/m.14772 type:complete len:354 (+) Transcript_6064:624-1685(+)